METIAFALVGLAVGWIFLTIFSLVKGATEKNLPVKLAKLGTAVLLLIPILYIGYVSPK